MTKAIYTGVGDTARKVKKLYIGIDGKARKVKKAYIGVNGVARLFYSSGWLLGAEMLSSTDTGQTSAISGYDAYTFNADTGVITLSGSKTSHSLSTLHSSGKPVYTAVSTDGHTLTLKRVPSWVYSSENSHYVEGTTTSSSAWEANGTTLSGYSSYSFDSSTGKYTLSGSASGTVASLYSSGQKIYVSGGDTLVWRVVDNKSATTSSGSTSISWGSSSTVASLSSSRTYTLSGAYSDYTISGGSIVLTGYVGSVTFYWDSDETYYTGGGSSITEYSSESGTTGSGTLYKRTGSLSSSGGSTTTEYRVTTYTKGSTYVAATHGSYSYSEGEFGAGTVQQVPDGTRSSGYQNYSFDSSTGVYSVSGYDSFGSHYSESTIVTRYEIADSGKTLIKREYYQQYERDEDWAIIDVICYTRTYTKGVTKTYIPVPLYKVETYTRIATEE